jgi:antiviral helicase SKI2
MIVDQHRITPMREAIKSLGILTHEWVATGHIPEVDWSKFRSLDFQETMTTRNVLQKKRGQCTCVTCPNFDDHVGIGYALSGYMR